MAAIRRLGPGPRISQAVVHGDTVYVAGQVSADAATVGGQTTAILAKIDALLAEAGTDKSRLLSTTVYLADMAGYAEMNAVWDGWIDPANTPARATVEAKLAAPRYLVEIAAVAAR